MSKKFIGLRRVVVPILTALVILCQTAPAAFAMSSEDVASLASTDQQVEIIMATPSAAASVAGYTVLYAATGSLAIRPVTPATDADMSRFADWNKSEAGWWFGKDSVKYAVGGGYINGKSGGGTVRLAGNDPVTVAEFTAILVRMSVSASDQAKYAAEAKANWLSERKAAASLSGETVTDADLEREYAGVEWKVSTNYTATKLGILTGVTYNTQEYGATDNCTRAAMCIMLVNAASVRNEDTSSVDTQAAINTMADKISIQHSGASKAIGTAIGMGLIAGDNNRNFNYSDTMTRASACEVIHRFDNPSGQREAVLQQIGLLGGGSSSTGNGSSTVTPGVPDGAGDLLNGGGNGNGNQSTTAPITIDMRNPGSHRAPREGDTVIRPDGSSVVLARDSKTGVLGYGQNVGAWLGTTSVLNGHDLVKGDVVDYASLGTDYTLASGGYIKSNLPGQSSTYHFASEWAAIKKATSPNRAGTKGTEGQVTSDGLWKCDSDGDWIWQGPSF